jgi:dihydrofolate reductase
VISSQANYNAPDCILVQNLSDALIAAKQNEENEVFVIGGGQVYREALELAVVDRMYITEVDAVFSDAEVFFPDFDEKHWEKIELSIKEKDEKHQFPFVVYEYNKKV